MGHKTGLLCAFVALAISGCGQNAQENASDAIEENVTNATAAAEDSASPSGPTIFCKAVERRISKEDCDDLAAIESQVKEGAAAFNVPDPMTRGDTVAIKLVIDRRSPEEIAAIDAAADEAAAENVAEMADANLVTNPDAVTNEAATNEAEPSQPDATSGPTVRPTPSQRVEDLEGRTETLVPQVGRYMSAELTGHGFEITPLTPRSQEIPPGAHATWQWSVTPTVEGPRQLTLKTIVEGEVGGKRYPLTQTETEKTVMVKVKPEDVAKDFVARAIDWLDRMKLLILAIAGVVGALWFLIRTLRGKGDKGG